MVPQGSPQTTNPVLLAVALRQMLEGYRISQSIYVAAKLGLGDLLKEGPKSSDELATSVEANPDALHRLLRVLASMGIFAQVGQRRFTLTPLGALLQTDVPGSLWGTAVLTGEWWWQTYGELLYSVKTSKPAHEPCLWHAELRVFFPASRNWPDIPRRNPRKEGTVVHGGGRRL
jgi:hypothetical protein